MAWMLSIMGTNNQTVREFILLTPPKYLWGADKKLTSIYKLINLDFKAF